MMTSTLITQNPNFFGKVSPPPAVAAYDVAAGGGGNIGLFLFISNAIKLVAIIAGLFSLFNIIFAGFTYITNSGDTNAVETAWKSIYMSLIGLILIVGSFTITAVISWLIFGDAMFILNPTIQGPSPAIP